MKMQVLSPTVEHGEEADLRTQMLGIGGNGPRVSAVARKRIPRTSSLF